MANELNLPILSVPLAVLGAVLCPLFGFIGLFGFVAISPNQARVFTLFGEYRGSARESGFYWVNPFYTQAFDFAAGSQL
ncbi:MAG UNVERIFIED_CONTAM: hypothetical protein LVR18_29265 [Planctomycetaceae bacterium]